MNKVLFLTFLVSFSAFGAVDDVIVEGDFVMSDCKYVKHAPTRWTIEQSCGPSKASSQGFCVGLIQCRYVNIRTRETGTDHRTVGCEANSNGSCPPPVECQKAAVDFISSLELTPKIQSKAEATLADQRARPYGNRSAVGQTTHTSGGR